MKAPIDTTSLDLELKLRTPEIVSFDIETFANKGEFWRNPWQTNIIEIVEHTYMASWSVKRLNGKQITKGLCDYEGYEPGVRDDKALVTELYHILEKADIVIAHNGNKFDIPYSKGRFLLNGLPPPKQWSQYDTRSAAKRHFGFTSNKLNDIAQLLGLGTKLPVGYEVWKGCKAGDPKAWRTMKAYNAHDTRLLEQVYLAFRAWDSSHPKLNSIAGQENPACPTCQSTDVWGRGFKPTKTGRRKQLRCNDCGCWFSGKHQAVTEYR